MERPFCVVVTRRKHGVLIGVLDEAQDPGDLHCAAITRLGSRTPPGSTYRLGAGDSLQFDGEGAHGPTALVSLPIRFLSIIAFPDTMSV